MTNKAKWYRFVAKDITTNEVVKKGRLCERRNDAVAYAEKYYNTMVASDASIHHGWNANRQCLSAIYGNIVLHIVRYDDYMNVIN